jgi:hypothetical protein
LAHALAPRQPQGAIDGWRTWIGQRPWRREVRQNWLKLSHPRLRHRNLSHPASRLVSTNFPEPKLALHRSKRHWPRVGEHERGRPFDSGWVTGHDVGDESAADERNREHNRIQRSPERNRTAAEMSFSTACLRGAYEPTLAPPRCHVHRFSERVVGGFACGDIDHAFRPLVQIARAFGGLRHIGHQNIPLATTWIPARSTFSRHTLS